MANVPFSVSQGKKVNVSNPMVVAAIGGDNGTPLYLNFPDAPPGRQWIFPFTYSFLIPFDPPSASVAPTVDASKTPDGFPVAPITTLQPSLTAYDTPQGFYNPGIQAPATGPTFTNWLFALPTGNYGVSSPLVNYLINTNKAKGIIVWAAINGAGTLTVTISDYIFAGAPLNVALKRQILSNAYTGGGVISGAQRIYPGITPVASPNVNAAASDIIGNIIALDAVVTVGAVNAAIAYILIP